MTTDSAPRLGPDDRPPLLIRYRNHRSEVAERRVLPHALRYGRTEWHPEPQWLLDAYDLDRKAERTFSMRDILRWGEPHPDNGRAATVRQVLYDAHTCPDCGAEMESADCDDCSGDGETAYGELAALDPLWYDEDDTEPCDLCGGSGIWWYCPECVAQAQREERLHNLAMAAEKGATDDRT